MDFFSFLQTEASNELAHRRALDLPQPKPADTVVSDGVEYVEGQLAKLSNTPSWVMPAVFLVGVLVLWKVTQ